MRPQICCGEVYQIVIDDQAVLVSLMLDAFKDLICSDLCVPSKGLLISQDGSSILILSFLGQHHDWISHGVP